MEDVSDSPPPELRQGAGRAGSRARRRPPPGATERVDLVLPADIVEIMRAKARVAGTSLDDLAAA